MNSQPQDYHVNHMPALRTSEMPAPYLVTADEDGVVLADSEPQTSLYLTRVQCAYFSLPYNSQEGKFTIIHQDALVRMGHSDAHKFPRKDLRLVGKGFAGSM